MVMRPLAVAAGVAADMLLGEPPLSPHPVAAFGRVLRAAEHRLYRDGRAAGVAHAGVGVALGAAAGGLVRSTAVAVYVATAGRALRETALAVGHDLARHDLPAARRRLPSLVGRDPTNLDEKEVARAVVESVAENTVDAVVAPAFWGVVGGAAGAGAYRAVNTLDAVVGHRTARYARYGWASARLDDAAAFVPARLTAALVAAVRPRQAGAVWEAVRRDAPAHPSPNAGVAEAAFAAALDLRLGGESRYGDRLEVRPSLGTGRAPDGGDIARAVHLSRDVTLALVAGLVLAAAPRQRRGDAA